MTRDEWAAQLTARAADAERMCATAPVAAVLRAMLEELVHVDGWSRSAPDEMLTLEEAAARANVSVRWLRDNRRSLPFLKQYVEGGKMRASARELARWLVTRGS